MKLHIKCACNWLCCRYCLLAHMKKNGQNICLTEYQHSRESATAATVVWSGAGAGAVSKATLWNAGVFVYAFVR